MADAHTSTAEAPWKPRYNPWLIAVVAALAAFMEVLDTSIAMVALPYIAGNLGATSSESTWVLTSYLVANAVVLPMSGFLAVTLGRKNYLTICVAGFTLASLFCGLSGSIGILLLARVLQGTFGGGLQPMGQAVLADSFPPDKRGLAFSLFGVTTVVAPIVGPVLGGWLTDNFSWRWIFYINVPVGLLTWVLMQRFIEDPPYLAKLKRLGQRIDYWGISLLVLGIGALQILLDKGQEDDWFGSRFITTLAVTSAVSLAALVIYEWRNSSPVLEVRLFKSFNYSAINLMMFLLGWIMFASLVSLPQFLQTMLGYTATQAGLVMSPAAMIVVCLLPISGFLAGKLSAKWIIAFGWTVLAVSMFYSTGFVTMELDFRTAMVLRMVQMAGLPFLFIPLTTAVYRGIPAEKNNQVSGTINFMRNLGSSVGTSFFATMLVRRAHFHQTSLAAHAGSFDPAWQQAVNGLARQLHALGGALVESEQRALALLNQSVLAQAAALGYVDVFWLLGVAALLLAGLALLLPRNDPRAGGTLALH